MPELEGAGSVYRALIAVFILLVPSYGLGTILLFLSGYRKTSFEAAILAVVLGLTAIGTLGVTRRHNRAIGRI